MRTFVLMLVLTSLSAAGRAPQIPKMRGFCWEGSREIEAASLSPLQDLGVDWISQTPFGWAPALAAPEIGWSGNGGLWGETDGGLVRTAAWAKALGIKTLLKPHVWVRRGEWQGDIAMSSEEDWSRWFASYEEFILHYARLAETAKFEALAVGTELSKSTTRTSDWKRLIARVREVYHGKLTYCANWNGETEQIGFWDDLDFIGVQAYYPLAAVDRPSTKEIQSAWAPIVGRLEALAHRTRKPIVFTEIGFKSHEGALREPWRWEADGAVDLGLQTDAFTAMFETFWRKPWFGGSFIWKWHPSARARARARDERDYTPQGKPALAVIKAYYSGR